MKYKINIVSHNKKVLADKGSILSDIITRAEINLSRFCNKKGLCGKCFVEILKKDIPPLNKNEEVLLNQIGLNYNYRLACQYRVTEDLKISIPDESILQEAEVLTTGIDLPVLIDPPVKKYYLKLSKPEINNSFALLRIKKSFSFLGLLKESFKNDNLKIDLGLLKKLPGLLKKNNYNISLAILNNSEVLDIEPGNTVNKNYGLAIDIGTSTVIVELMDLNSGKGLDIEYKANLQMKYGLDVISRISFAYKDPGNLELLQRTIINQLNKMIRAILKRKKISKQYIYEAVIAGNTAMNHLFLNVSVKSLALAPYNAGFTKLPELGASKAGLNINHNGEIYIAPNIKSFVGGDISAGIIASGMIERKGNYLFIDLGTNGEIVLKKGREFIAAATAAGPAFEGMNISCGMMAVPGAVYKAEYKKRLKIYTIKNKKPAGICGTGLIDLVSIFLSRGDITGKGMITHNKKKIRITENIFITQNDIREIQLAIAAVKAGIKFLLDKYGVSISKLDGILIGGAFGNYLNIKNAQKISLLPPASPDKVIFLGNTALAGAKALLISGSLRKKIEELIDDISYCSLGMEPSFQEYFIEALDFKKE